MGDGTEATGNYGEDDRQLAQGPPLRMQIGVPPRRMQSVMDHLLPVELRRHVEFKRRLLESYPDIDEVTLADSLEGCTNLNESLIAAVRQLRHDEAAMKVCEELMIPLAERIGRLKMRAERTKTVVLQAMQDAGMAKLPAADFTLSVRPSPASVVVTDATKIPQDYLVFPEPRADKRLIKQALQDGVAVPGCELSNGGFSLSIRT